MAPSVHLGFETVNLSRHRPILDAERCRPALEGLLRDDISWRVGMASLACQLLHYESVNGRPFLLFSEPIRRKQSWRPWQHCTTCSFTN